jgi:hypothetical protein
MIDFPSAPTVDQEFTSGNYTYRFDGIAWVSVPGTGSSGIPDAPADGVQYGRQDTAWTPVVGVSGIEDGTVTAPGLAFTAEPGLGFWRSGDGEFKLAQGGSTVWGVTGTATDTFSAQYAKAPTGKSVFSVTNAPEGTVDYNQMDFGIDQTMANISVSAVGAATQKPFTHLGASRYQFDSHVDANFSVNIIGYASNAAQLILNKGAAAAENVIQAQSSSLLLYRLIMGDGGTGQDIHWQRYDDAGVFSGTFMQVRRSDGLVSFTEATGVALSGPLQTPQLNLGANYLQFRSPDAHYLQYASGWYWSWATASGQLIWAGASKPSTVFSQNGDFHAGLSLFCGAGDASLGLVVNGSYPYIRFSADNWRLQMDRTTGGLQYINPANALLWNVDGAGNTNNIAAHQSGGRITSASGDGAALYAPYGGVRADIALGSAFYAPNGGITVCGLGSRGVVYSASQNDGGYINVYALAGNPSWNMEEFLFTHQAGVWAGARVVGIGQEIQFVLSNGATGWGAVKAAAFEVQSDERIKTQIRALPSQHDAFMGIAPIGWHWAERAVQEGDPPIYADLREEWGFSAQNLNTSVPLAVKGDVTAVDEQGKPITAGVNPVPIIALTVLEVQALWAHIATLEARIVQLEAV